ncbi:MAG: bifunctional phosphopantothenoylcysteine decarboxylase/phosphopantothenate--cysteine ligase CoaBC [Dehalococcoidia bacterium]|nr:bifunctional phosphopantothenoylcysteine decarboxylase/phosphopantothenate--cysteine ligase CoaBC [Dehalococcoidia bacterium]
MMRDKTVLLGVTGSIAAYKAVDLASKLTQAGAKVDVVMTDSAKEFVTPLSFSSITHCRTVTNMFDTPDEWEIEHVALAERADVVIIAPATANVIAKLASGIADDMLTCCVLATRAPVILAPAMNVNMWENRVTQENLAKLRARGFKIVEPGTGSLACGAQGKGRLADIEDILTAISQALRAKADLAGRRVVVSAGGTQEPIDPVRYVGNRSSGKMGFAMAEAARDRGAEVTLITGPTTLGDPAGMRVVRVQTALEMRDAVKQAAQKADILIMAAAPADFRPATVARSKIKKESTRGLTLKLVPNPDIISEVKGDIVKVGFAAESEDLVKNATAKLKRKSLHLIVANNITEAHSGFGTDTNKVTLIDSQGKVEALPLLPKSEVAQKVLDKVVSLLNASRKNPDKPRRRK